MKRTKSIALMLLSFLMVWSVLPWGSLPQVEAAAKYFFFSDNDVLQNSTPDNPYIYNSSVIDLNGTFNEVQSDSITLKVEQIYENGGTYDVVEGQFYTRDVTVTGVNQFEINSVTLFAGLNRLTLSGKKGGVNLQDQFYILYDNAPYLVDLKIQTNTDGAIPLNAGKGTVVTSSQAFFEGTAPNAEKIVINDQYEVQPLDDGTFYSSIINLNPGENVVTFDIIGDTDQFSVQRTVFYYDGLKLMYNGDLTIDDGTVSTTQDVVEQSPTYTVSFAVYSSGHFSGDLMIPDTGVTFDASNITITNAPTGSVQNVTVGAPTLFSSGSGDYLSYPIDFDIVNIDPNVDRFLNLQVVTNHTGTGNADVTQVFNYSLADRDQNIVTEVRWLPNYQPSSPDFNAIPLDGANVDNSVIYVEVVQNQPSYSGALEVYEAPYDPNSTPLTVTQVGAGSTNVPSGHSSAVYEIRDIQPGTHTFVFNYNGTPDYYKYFTTFNYMSGAHIIFTNVYDGMVIDEVNAPTVLKGIIQGVPVDYDPNLSASSITINGDVTPNPFANYTAPGQEFNIDISATSLVPGENVIEAVLEVGGYTIIKQMKVFVKSNNLPYIFHYKPVIMSGPPVLSDSNQRDNMYTDLTGFQFLNGVYYTNETKIDMIMEVSNFEKVILSSDGDNIFEYLTKAVDPTDPNQLDNFPGVTNNGENIDHYYIQSTDTLIIFIDDMDMSTPGTRVYNLKVVNDSGSQASQRLEIVREVLPYKILSPVANNGDKIIVNKNFVNVKIQAEGADSVLVDDVEARKLNDPNCEDCFEYEYLGLKENDWNEIEFVVLRGPNEIEGTIEVFYANQNVQGAMFKEPLDRRHKVFNDAIELEFEKGTLLRTVNPINGLHRLYENQRILFGMADPDNGLVEKVTDDGQNKSASAILANRFSQYPDNFTFISPVYWISGGLAEKGNLGSPDYEPSMHGLPPHSNDLLLTYTRYDQDRKLVPSQRGELTIKYDEMVRIPTGVIVTVFYFDETGNWVNIGGVIDAKKREITVPFDRFGYYVVAKMRYSFDDIQNHPWARNVLEAMFAKGFMDKVRYDEFGSDDYITRGEFAQLMVKALQLPLVNDNRNTFFDVQPGSRYGNLWEYKYIETAARAGIVRGLDNRIFGPNQRLTRQQAAVMIARALEYDLPTNDEKLLEKLKKEFTDFSNIDYYARPSVMAVFGEDIMIGKENVTLNNPDGNVTYRFDPNSNLTRAEAAAIAVRIMQSELDYFPKNLK
ncbi:MAG: S-layer homology domain-containing protein [Bacillaceae bacterium]|nr:S-layer homology domain-containing protein [Bacillaceae bacterium]